jgi:hypothetical protein
MTMRPFETRYWFDQRQKTPMSRGFPKAEEGSIKGRRRSWHRASPTRCNASTG